MPFFGIFLPHFWGVTHTERHPHPQIFCGIVAHDTTNIHRKNYSYESHSRYKNFGLKMQKMRFFEIFKLFLWCNPY